ncbi:MAG: hypothetical protein EBU28_12600, partial [Gammaproteobacteria bacterium]|nr:hypothetical protein [Gammaproteobacteria bacterium]
IGEMESIDADISICWAKQGMIDAPHERLFACPACPTGNDKIAARVLEDGLDKIMLSAPLLLDSSESTGWQDWFNRAGLDYKNSQQGLSIADSNSRVQAVIDKGWRKGKHHPQDQDQNHSSCTPPIGIHGLGYKN